MIKKSSLTFLSDLQKNNNREWFAEQKHRYDEAREDVLNFISELIPHLSYADPQFPADTQPKKCLLRIYRDVRFSKNKDPYKNNYGITFTKGKSLNEPDYYLHLQPGQCFFGAGFWMPEAAYLKMIREEIDYNSAEFRQIISNNNFTSCFHLDETDTLKNAPKGYDPDHPEIAFLKLKSFIAIYSFEDKELFSGEIVDKLKTAFLAVQPFVLFLRNAVQQ